MSTICNITTRPFVSLEKRKQYNLHYLKFSTVACASACACARVYVIVARRGLERVCPLGQRVGHTTRMCSEQENREGQVIWVPLVATVRSKEEIKRQSHKREPFMRACIMQETIKQHFGGNVRWDY